MKTLDLALKASDHFGQATLDPEKKLPEAIIFGVNDEGISVLSSAMDIYDAITQAHESSAVNNGYAAVGALTGGWAAPLEKGEGEPSTPPSEHPERSRVTLITVFTRQTSASVIHFADGSHFTDEGEGRGALANELSDLAHCLCA
jgi:hypothetical protein